MSVCFGWITTSIIAYPRRAVKSANFSLLLALFFREPKSSKNSICARQGQFEHSILVTARRVGSDARDDLRLDPPCERCQRTEQLRPQMWWLSAIAADEWARTKPPRT